jgi:membrane protein DedA with SNARE-associated domain
MEHWFHPLILWLHLHPNAAGLVTFLITFIESLAIIGLVIPGSVTLSAIGGLVGSGVVPATPIFIWAICGAILGDAISYWIGYHYHDKLKKMWPFYRFPKLIAKGENFFRKHGGKGIFISRFIGPMRPVMPLIAGMMRVHPAKFIIVEFISGILWAPVYMLPGILVGAAAAHFAPHHVLHYLLILLVIIFVLWLAVKLILSTASIIISSWGNIINLWWQRLKRKKTWLYHLLVENHHISSSRPLNLAIFSTLFFLAYVLLFFVVRMQLNGVYHFNLDFLSFFTSINSNTGRMIAITISNYLGFSVAILAGTIAILLYFSYKRDWHAARHFFGLIAATFIVTIISKELSDSLRPQTILQQEPTLSYPSTHVVLCLVFWGYVAFFVSHRQPAWIKKVSYSIAGIFTLAVSFSQLYLNAHWITDIFGALCLGGFLLTAAAITFHWRETIDRFSPAILCTLALLTVILAATTYQLKYYQQQTENYYLPYQISYIDETQWWHSTTSQLPLYRNNRFNQPVAILNLQWLGTLDNIEASLLQHGWLQPIPLGYQALKQQLIGNPLPTISPIPAQFANHNPVLTLIKPLSTPDTYLILNLWDNYYYTNDNKIYLGSISYHFPMQQWLLQHNNPSCTAVYPAAISQLQPVLNDWQNRSVSFQPEHDFKANPCVAIKNEILLLKEKQD